MGIRENVERVQKNLTGQVIVAAAKYVGVPEIRELVAAGVHDIGENRTDQPLAKQEALKTADIVWHFIGHLQSKKVPKVINRIDFLHSLDRESLADAIQKYREKPLSCFLEANISGEENKTGMPLEKIPAFVEYCLKLDKIRLVGLMGMAENSEDEARIGEQFERLVRLRQNLREQFPGLALPYLSMGMSHDYHIAIRHQATHVRLGTILFQK